MSHIICIMISVFISTAIMFYVLKVAVEKTLENIKQTSDMGMKYTEDMCQITINGILDILKKRGVINKDVGPIHISKSE